MRPNLRAKIGVALPHLDMRENILVQKLGEICNQALCNFAPIFNKNDIREILVHKQFGIKYRGDFIGDVLVSFKVWYLECDYVFFKAFGHKALYFCFYGIITRPDVPPIKSIFHLVCMVNVLIVLFPYFLAEI